MVSPFGLFSGALARRPNVLIFSLIVYVCFPAFSKIRSHPTQIPRTTDAQREIAFTAWSKIQSQSQIFRYGRSIFCLPHRPNFSDKVPIQHHTKALV